MRKFLDKNRYYLFLTLCFLGFGILIALITSVINYRTDFHNIVETVSTISSDEADRKTEILSAYISGNEKQIYSISKNNLMKFFIQNPDLNSRSNAESLFSAMVYSNIDIMQLRYIDESGQEVVRIDRDINTSELNIVSVENLQDKSDRYYFKEAIGLEQNSLWHSNIDLNMENGEIEIPYNSTYRLAIPIYIDGINRGIIISNLRFNSILEESVYSNSFDICLVDKDGDVLYNSRTGHIWSKYLDNRSNLYDLKPDVAEALLLEDNLTSDGLFSYDMNTVFKNSEDIRMIFTVKNSTIENLKSENLIQALIIALTVFLISIPLSWIVSYVPSSLQSKLNMAYEEIKKQSNIIDENVMIIRTDNMGLCVDSSKYFSEITGFTKDELLGKKHYIFNNNEMCHELKNGDKLEIEVNGETKSEQLLWLHTIISPKLDPEGNIESLTAICENITDKKKIEQMSETDTLTGLKNRRRLLEVYNNEKSRAERYDNVFSLMLYDIDFFKKVNDVYGHLAGDDVLKTLSDIVKRNIRDNDYLCRWGGEEFLIISENKDVNETVKLAEKIRLLVEEYDFPVVGKITISCGVTQFINGEKLEQSIARVDLALYDAKSGGRNKVVMK